ncbi:DUF2528 family protein [Desulfamplus magnetovallimortis]|nr:DUF2528 family protein [Desulfamplus magnetovallimortis]
MSTKQYQIVFDWWDALLEISDSQETKEAIEKQLRSFSDGQKLLDEENGDVIQAYLKQMSTQLITASIDCTLSGVVKLFQNKDDFLSLDGSMGVKLLSIDNWVFHLTDFEFEEV